MSGEVWGDRGEEPDVSSSFDSFQSTWPASSVDLGAKQRDGAPSVGQEGGGDGFDFDYFQSLGEAQTPSVSPAEADNDSAKDSGLVNGTVPGVGAKEDGALPNDGADPPDIPETGDQALDLETVEETVLSATSLVSAFERVIAQEFAAIQTGEVQPPSVLETNAHIAGAMLRDDRKAGALFAWVEHEDDFGDPEETVQAKSMAKVAILDANAEAVEEAISGVLDGPDAFRGYTDPVARVMHTIIDKEAISEPGYRRRDEMSVVSQVFNPDLRYQLRVTGYLAEGMMQKAEDTHKPVLYMGTDGGFMQAVDLPEDTSPLRIADTAKSWLQTMVDEGVVQPEVAYSAKVRVLDTGEGILFGSLLVAQRPSIAEGLQFDSPEQFVDAMNDLFRQHWSIYRVNRYDTTKVNPVFEPDPRPVIEGAAISVLDKIWDELEDTDNLWDFAQGKTDNKGVVRILASMRAVVHALPVDERERVLEHIGGGRSIWANEESRKQVVDILLDNRSDDENVKRWQDEVFMLVSEPLAKEMYAGSARWSDPESENVETVLEYTAPLERLQLTDRWLAIDAERHLGRAVVEAVLEPNPFTAFTAENNGENGSSYISRTDLLSAMKITSTIHVVPGTPSDDKLRDVLEVQEVPEGVKRAVIILHLIHKFAKLDQSTVNGNSWTNEIQDIEGFIRKGRVSVEDVLQAYNIGVAMAPAEMRPVEYPLSFIGQWEQSTLTVQGEYERVVEEPSRLRTWLDKNSGRLGVVWHDPHDEIGDTATQNRHAVGMVVLGGDVHLQSFRPDQYGMGTIVGVADTYHQANSEVREQAERVGSRVDAINFEVPSKFSPSDTILAENMRNKIGVASEGEGGEVRLPGTEGYRVLSTMQSVENEVRHLGNVLSHHVRIGKLLTEYGTVMGELRKKENKMKKLEFAKRVNNIALDLQKEWEELSALKTTDLFNDGASLYPDTLMREGDPEMYKNSPWIYILEYDGETPEYVERLTQAYIQANKILQERGDDINTLHRLGAGIYDVVSHLTKTDPRRDLYSVDDSGYVTFHDQNGEETKVYMPELVNGDQQAWRLVGGVMPDVGAIKRGYASISRQLREISRVLATTVQESRAPGQSGLTGAETVAVRLQKFSQQLPAEAHALLGLSEGDPKSLWDVLSAVGELLGERTKHLEPHEIVKGMYRAWGQRHLKALGELGTRGLKAAEGDIDEFVEDVLQADGGSDAWEDAKTHRVMGRLLASAVDRQFNNTPEEPTDVIIDQGEDISLVLQHDVPLQVASSSGQTTYRQFRSGRGHSITHGRPGVDTGRWSPRQ